MNKFNEENPMPVFKEKQIIKVEFPRENTKLERKCHNLLKENKLIEIENFLSEEQCKFLIDLTENLKFEKVDWEYPEKYRSNSRIVVFYEDLADYLWEKAEKILEHKDYWNIRPFGIGTSGKWYPYGINSCIRFSKYEQGQYFDKHKDGAFVITDNNRSIFTLMVYLNTISNSGTKFIEDSNIITVNPVVGKALIFNHDIEHEGLYTTNVKYILRTDIMFFRIGFINDKSYLSNNDYKTAVIHFNNSIRLQHESQPEESTKEYIKGQDILTKYKSYPYGIHKISDKNENPSVFISKRNNISQLKPFDNEKVKLNPIICKTIFEHLCTQKFDVKSLKELLDLRLVNSTWNLFLTNNSIWKEVTSKILGYDFDIYSTLYLENTNSELFSIKLREDYNFYDKNINFFSNNLSKSYILDNYDKDDRYMCYFINRFLTSIKKKRLIIDLGLEYIHYMYNFDNSPNHEEHRISDYYKTNRHNRCYRTLPWAVNEAMNSWYSGFGSRTVFGVEPIKTQEFKLHFWSVRRRNKIKDNFAQLKNILLTSETSLLLAVPYEKRNDFTSDYLISREKFFLKGLERKNKGEINHGFVFISEEYQSASFIKNNKVVEYISSFPKISVNDNLYNDYYYENRNSNRIEINYSKTTLENEQIKKVVYNYLDWRLENISKDNQSDENIYFCIFTSNTNDKKYVILNLEKITDEYFLNKKDEQKFTFKLKFFNENLMDSAFNGGDFIELNDFLLGFDF